MITQVTCFFFSENLVKKLSKYVISVKKILI